MASTGHSMMGFPGMSREKWGYLPAADNDFIYAILGEEWGLVGTLLVLEFARRVAGPVLPIIALGAYAILAFVPILSVVRWAKTAENATDYSLQKKSEIIQ